jgi:hypothetical protein
MPRNTIGRNIHRALAGTRVAVAVTLGVLVGSTVCVAVTVADRVAVGV